MTTTIQEQIRCLHKEIIRRKMIYPKKISENKMDEKTASYEIQTMQDAMETLSQLKGIVTQK